METLRRSLCVLQQRRDHISAPRRRLALPWYGARRPTRICDSNAERTLSDLLPSYFELKDASFGERGALRTAGPQAPNMPSIRALGTFALVLAARPAQSFLTPTSGRTRKGYSLPASCRTPFCGRLQRASSSAASTGGRPRRTRGGAGGVLMMAKKKASGKKKAGGKGGSAQGSRKVGRNISSSGSLTVDTNKAGGENGSGSGVAIADAEDVSGVANASGSSTSVGSSSDDAGVEVTTIQNRVSDIEPVEVSEEVSAVGAVVEPSESESGKGFGAPISQPKAPPRKAGSGSTSRPGVPVTSMMGGGEESTSDPVPTQTIAAPGTSQNPMSPSAVPMDDSHRMVLPEGSGELSEASLELDEGVGAMTTDPSQMTPLDLLRYFRDNNIAVDLETMNPVEIPAEREAKMAAMFPFPTEEARARRSLGPRPKPSEFVKAMVALLPEDAPWDPKKIRPLTELKEFLVANRLHSGSRAMNVISSMMLKAMGQGDLEHAKTLKGLGICIAKAEDAITGPFRQAVMSAEGRLAPRMGSLECEEYAGEDGADMAGMWIVLKACVAEWELRLRQIRQEEVGLHDIFRAIPNPAEGLSEDRAASITASVQAMGMSFSGNEKLMGSLPAELRFLEGALGLSTTTDVRRFALQEFCPKEGVSPEDLRFRMRSLICGLEQMPRNSYHQLQVAVEDVTNCLMEGTPEAYNIYNDNWQEGENLSFDTYRVKTEDKRRLRLRNIITAPAVTQKTKEENPYEPLFKQILPKGLWKAADVTVEDEETPYVMVKEGWLDSLDFLDEELTQYRQAKTDSMRKTLPELEPGEEGWNADPSDDIFTDWLQQEESMFLDFELTDDEEIIAASGIRDGPGPGMRELDMGFDLPEEFEEMAAKLEDDDSTDTFIKRS